MKSRLPGVFVKTILSSMLLFLSLNTQAEIVTFCDRTTFLSATEAETATGTIPNLGRRNSSTVGDDTFSDVPPGAGIWIGTGTSFDWTPINPGNDIAVDGIEDLNVDLANPVFALGFDFVEPSVDCAVDPRLCFDSTFEVTILDGLTSVGVFTFNAPDDVLAFVGVWSDVSFNRVEIRDLTATVDDEYFGEFYTSNVPVSLAVTIDIKPGSDPNAINLKSRGVIPVAILTTDTFDATTVDHLSAEFGPAGATEAHGRGHVEDVDGDMDWDLVLHFKTQVTGIACGEDEASLTGQATIDGMPITITGMDAIKTVGCKK